jgi:hypothetical protein
MISRLSNILIPYKLVEIILSWIFPVPKKTEISRENKVMDVMIQYFLLVNEIPYNDFSIQLYEDKWVHIQLTYESVEDAYEYIKKEHQLEKDMSNMFPYKFVVEFCVS